MTRGSFVATASDPPCDDVKQYADPIIRGTKPGRIRWIEQISLSTVFDREI
ncbi:hypothetical protein ACE6H2_027323 [Prunus campanulata]